MPNRRLIAPLFFRPCWVVLLVASFLVVITIALSGGNPLALAHLGTRFSQGAPHGSEGYDGQFVYYIARNPDPHRVAPFLDVPAYRYQRILLPLLARTLALGDEQRIAWLLPILGVLSLALGTLAVEKLLQGWGVNPWYALIYGLWAGFLLALLSDLPEPLAFGLVAAAILALDRGRTHLAWLFFGLALFAKEVTLLFAIAALLASLYHRRWREVAEMGVITFLPFSLFQLWQWKTFGQIGLSSGGAMATPFEWLPLMGLWRIGAYSLLYLAGMAIVFIPTVVLPALWGLHQAVSTWLAGRRNVIGLGLLINSLVIFFLPFSTFREPGGLIRFASGLMLAVLSFAGYYQQRRILNYSLFWWVLNVFLLKQFTG